MTLRSSPRALDPRPRDNAEDDPRFAAAPPVETSARLNVSIINYRTAETTRRCLDALMAAAHPDAAVTIVDNASGDGSAEAITDWIAAAPRSIPVALIRFPRNTGFSGGHNQGMAAQPGARFHLILNSDALVRPGALDALLAAAEANPKAGLIAPRLEWEDGEIQTSAFRKHSPFSELIRGAVTGPVTTLLHRWDVPLPPPTDPKEVDWVSFACVLLRAEALKDVGHMDEGYFLYFEDADYCHRLSQAGWEIAFAPEARIVHLRGGSAPVKSLAAARKRLPAYWYASRTRLLYRLHGHTGLLAANLLWHLGRGIAQLRRLFGKPVPQAVDGEWRDIWINFLDPLGDPRAPSPSTEDRP
ncbi:MAG: glycosyltransferase family 2 protein [Pseudomonadota bacterium]